MGLRTLYQQDGVYYNPSTKEVVNLNDLGKPAAKVSPAQEALVCKFCGAKRATPELFREHLLAIHPKEVGPLNAQTPEEQPPAEPAAKTEPAPAKPSKPGRGKGK